MNHDKYFLKLGKLRYLFDRVMEMVAAIGQRENSDESLLRKGLSFLRVSRAV